MIPQPTSEAELRAERVMIPQPTSEVGLRAERAMIPQPTCEAGLRAERGMIPQPTSEAGLRAVTSGEFPCLRGSLPAWEGASMEGLFFKGGGSMALREGLAGRNELQSSDLRGFSEEGEANKAHKMVDNNLLRLPTTVSDVVCVFFPVEREKIH